MADVPHTEELVASRAAADTAWRTVTVVGDLDMATVDDLLAAVHREGADARCILLDLRQVPFCDVVGLSGLIRASAQLAAAGSQLQLASPPPSLRRMLRVLNLHPLDLGRMEPPASELPGAELRGAGTG